VRSIEPEPSKSPPPWRGVPGEWAGALGVALAALVVHGRSVAFGFVDLDDRDFIVGDRAFLAHPADVLRAFARPYMQVVDPSHPYQRPLVTASYVLDAQWSGVRPLGYHVTNVGLHALASVLCLALLRRLGFGRLVSVLCALTFAVHPALASNVAWIPGRNDSLLAVFVLGAWIAFIAYCETRSRRAHVIHLGLFALALFTKETAVMLPLVCSAYCMTSGWSSRRARPYPDARRDAHPEASPPEGPSEGPPEVAGVRCILGILPGWAACVTARLLARPFAPAAAQPTLVDIASHLRLLPSGLGQIVFPFGPSLVGVVSGSPVGGGLLAVVLVAAVMVLTRRVRPQMVLFGAAWFALWSLPSLIVPGTLVLGSRLYLPAVGAVIAAAELIRAPRLEPRVLAAFGGAAILGLALAAAGYEETFRNPRAFARAAVEGAPRSAVAHLCMAAVDQRAGDDDGALAEYKLALSLGSTYVAHNNVAVIHMARGRWADAERELRDELAVDPAYALAYRNLAIVLRHEGRPDEATAVEARANELAGGDEPGGGPTVH